MPEKNAKTLRWEKSGQFTLEAQQGEEQGDLFICEIVNWLVKDDIASMEFPLFSLAKQKDTKTREYRRGNKTVRIIPSSVGAATVFDKDLLLYIGSQIVEARNKGLMPSRSAKISSIDFLLGTERGDGAGSYERIINMLRRLRGTTIETNIPTGEKKVTQTDGFSMIDTYTVLSGKKGSRKIVDKKTGKSEEVETEKVFSFTVKISEWLYNGLMNFEVLTLDRGYFKLSSPIERRLYEIARKHCGDQPIWKINIDLLAEKIGTSRERFKVRQDIRQAIQADALPQYRVALDPSAAPDDVVFYTRNTAKLSMELIRTNCARWFQTLERYDNVEKWRKQKVLPASVLPANADV
uniref:Replication initiation protein n=2 Tax=Polaromonas sp. H8N TaxID=1840297 RepID=A0A2S1FJA4_9BURK|nr:replication initiation protein [Polaromonas sp. H8N]